MRKWKKNEWIVFQQSFFEFLSQKSPWMNINVSLTSWGRAYPSNSGFTEFFVYCLYGNPVANFRWKKKRTHLDSASLPSMVVTWIIREISTTDYLGLGHFEFCSTNPPKRGTAILLWNDESFMDPFFKIDFLKIVSRIYIQILSSIGPTVFKKNDFFRWKLTILKNAYLVNYLDIGGCQRSTDVTNRFGTLFTAKRCYCYGSFFSFLEVWSNFSWKSNKKWVLKNVHFLVNYATFENYAYGQVL